MLADRLPEKCDVDGVEPLSQQEPVSPSGDDQGDPPDSHPSAALRRPGGAGRRVLGRLVPHRRR